jgi:hypothetical protein
VSVVQSKGAVVAVVDRARRKATVATIDVSGIAAPSRGGCEATVSIVCMHGIAALDVVLQKASVGAAVGIAVKVVPAN